MIQILNIILTCVRDPESKSKSLSLKCKVLLYIQLIIKYKKKHCEKTIIPSAY